MRFIIPFGPGAGADIGARLIQERLQKKWGQPVVIENRPGGDSIIAIQAVLSANDDHTFLWGPSGNFIVHPFQYKKLPYDPNDIVPVARFSSTILGVGVPASMNIKTVAEFVKRGARRTTASSTPPRCPASPSWRSTTSCTTHKIDDAEGALQGHRAGRRSIVGEGRLQIYSSSYAILRPHHEGGRITVLAQLGKERAPSLPNIPTGIEAGFPELEMDGNVGLFASKARAGGAGRAHRRRHRRGRPTTRRSRTGSTQTAQTPARGGAKEFADSIARAARQHREDREDAGHPADAVDRFALPALRGEGAERAMRARRMRAPAQNVPPGSPAHPAALRVATLSPLRGARVRSMRRALPPHP